ncbi:hypothetical protein PC116_g18672 [Phytophthora cactorum]|uniref:Uncharacterized protein n=1 Tax=Phytophthora cactorum TaxID=29920 RepID=A0A8T1KFP6_9STRA|nr:hypothetical protein PC114_g19391 [Phytophthora cactorum]KAG2936217.1 hypothetical protein PC117_g12153 [Phytophthora cactorum]KAG2991919.1 hypothetical protein PC119_g18767 [Phytophthora cactorum]KAG3011091.1 hypothetical protein PC120_g14651 [Phytophthora cactorum]KAG3151628.1 hypothetical protein C6341_g16500 [Phytophthora cactorum]
MDSMDARHCVDVLTTADKLEGTRTDHMVFRSA